MKMPEICPIWQNWQCNVNNRLQVGFTKCLSRECWAFSRDLLDKKSKSLLFPGAGGPWLQMTSALGCFLLVLSSSS